jgi:hypothetical protein
LITAQKTVRFPLDVYKKIESAVKKRPDSISENKWIIEACEEKAAREKRRNQ